MQDFNMAETHCTALNVFAEFRPTLPAEYTRAPVLFLANISPDLQLHTLEQMPDEAISICDTMNLWIDNTRDQLAEVFSKVDVVVMNDGEARSFTGTSNVIRAGYAMMEYGIKYCIIKKGEHGSVAFGRNGFFAALPAYPVEKVYDPTGAGDSFAGGFTGHIARTGALNDVTVRKAMRWGTVMGSFNVGAFSCDAFRGLDEAALQERMTLFESYIA
jgi:sugar/nucleoside kinase (ribokinase family)